MLLIESIAWLQLVDSFIDIKFTCPSAKASFSVNLSQVALINLLLNYRYNRLYFHGSQNNFSPSLDNGYKTDDSIALKFNQLQIEEINITSKLPDKMFLKQLKIFPILLKVDLWFDQLSGKCLKPDLAQ